MARWGRDGGPVARETITPTSVERPFEVHELFFSTTDRKGIIRSGNRVFARVAGYDESELVGEPHNIIRHPDMPRAVFRLLWDYLERGAPIAAYVKNMARDGGYYWVLATVVGIEDGYLSVRMKPVSELLPVVDGLYAELRAVERDIEGRGGKPSEAIAASTPLLGERLAGLGFTSYDAFMHAALPAEMRAREAVAARRQSRATRPNPDLDPILASIREVHRYLRGRFRDLDRYDELKDAFDGGSKFVLDLAENIRLFALNSQIGAARLGSAGLALGAIANLMRTRSDATASEIDEMQAQIAPIMDALQTMAFDTGMATLQSEMAAQFIEELIEAEDSSSAGSADRSHALAANVGALGGALRERVAPLIESLGELDGRVIRVSNSVEALSRELGRLDALQVAGRVETARVAEAGDFRVLFEDVRQQIAVGRSNLHRFDVLSGWRNNRRGSETLRFRLAKIEHWVASTSEGYRAA